MINFCVFLAIFGKYVVCIFDSLLFGSCLMGFSTCDVVICLYVHCVCCVLYKDHSPFSHCITDDSAVILAAVLG